MHFRFSMDDVVWFSHYNICVRVHDGSPFSRSLDPPSFCIFETEICIELIDGRWVITAIHLPLYVKSSLFYMTAFQKSICCWFYDQYRLSTAIKTDKCQYSHISMVPLAKWKGLSNDMTRLIPFTDDSIANPAHLDCPRGKMKKVFSTVFW